MAHFILEYSTNLTADELDVGKLLAEIVQCAVDTGIFPQAGCRARAHPCEDYYIADGNDAHAFVHLQVKLGAGRSTEEKDKAQTALVDMLDRYFKQVGQTRGLAISFELTELPSHKSNVNNIREYL